MPSASHVNLFNELATLTGAGISILDAAQKISASYPHEKTWIPVIAQLKRGHKLSRVLAKHGLITRYEQEIISIAELTGRIPEGLKSIAQAYDKRKARIGSLKAKLYYPLAILVVAIIVSAILELTRNPDITFFVVFSRALVGVGIALLMTKTLINFMQKDACSVLKLAARCESASWYKVLYQHVVFGALQWHVRAGLDFKSAFTHIALLVDTQKGKRQLLAVGKLCEQGLSVTEAIAKAYLPISDELKQILSVAEKSGQWELSLAKFLQQNTLMLNLNIESAFEWAPRLYYAFIVFVVLAFVI